jgi:RNA polymerase sigma-70 factor (sigma-E family)
MRDDDDFSEYVRANGGRLLRLAYLYTGNPATAQDVVQSVLCKAMLSWRRIAGDNPDAYLARSIFNERTSLWRRMGRREVLGGSLPERTVNDATAIADLRHQLVRALAQLPARQRAAVVLRYLEDLPDEQTALVLGCTPATVRSHVARGLARLRPLLTDLEDVPEGNRLS